MASIEQDPKSRNFRIRFRFGHQRFNRSLRTDNEKAALSVCARVEETLRLIEQGRIDVPEGIDLGKFVLSDGKIQQSTTHKAISVAELLALYEADLIKSKKEDSTVRTERTHISHFLRLMKLKQPVRAFTFYDLQNYVDRRLSDKCKNRPISCETVQRELTTFTSIWKWARPEYVSELVPTLWTQYDQA